MYLMDEIVGFADMMKIDQRLSHPVLSHPVLSIFPELKQKLIGTPRFLLSNDAIRAAVEISLSRPKIILESLAHLRIPYNRLWIEWDESGREKLRETFRGDSPIETPDRPLPSHIGFLIETKEGGRSGTVTWAWNVKDSDTPNIAPITAYFDLDQDIEQPVERILGLERANLATLWNDNPVQKEALLAIWRTAIHKPSPWGEKFIQTMLNRASLQDQLAHYFSDVFGEYITIWSIMLLLTTSRKAVDYIQVDRSKLNKSRIKSRNPSKTLLLDHTQVVLHFDKHTAQQTHMPQSYQRKSPRVHVVSSYLARRGDKHWLVSPYIRGQGEWVTRHVHVKS